MTLNATQKFNTRLIMDLSIKDISKIILTMEPGLRTSIPDTTNTLLAFCKEKNISAFAFFMSAVNILIAAAITVGEDDGSPMCTKCGIAMQRTGKCHTCTQCGETNGCS